MTSIVRFRFSGLWNSEYPLVVNRILDIAGAHNPHAKHLGVSFDRLEAFRQQLAKIEVQERADRDSAKLSELDQQRDTLFNIIYAVAKAFQRTPMLDVSHNAAQIIAAMKKHGYNIPAANYTAETKRLYDLNADFLSQPDLMAALSALSLKPLFERMDVLNKEFDQLFMQRSKRQAETEKIDIRTIRIECDKALTMFWNTIEFRCAEYGEEEYIKLVNEINNLNTYYKQQLAARAARRKAKQDVDKEEPIKPMNDE